MSRRALIARPCCTGREEEPAALAAARQADRADLLRQCIASGRVSAAQLVAHHTAGDMDGAHLVEPEPSPEPPHSGALDWWHSLSAADRRAAIRRAF